jgi:tryptophan halogenase
LFPDKGFAQSDADEFNRRMNLNYERVRDFLLLHYVANRRTDSPMWQHFQNLRLPDSLQEKIDAWLTRGYIIKYEFGVFLPPSWIAVMLGQNLRPRGYDRRADAAPKDILVKNAAAILQSVRVAAQNAPDHAAYIRQIGAASETAPLMAKGSPSP